MAQDAKMEMLDRITKNPGFELERIRKIWEKSHVEHFIAQTATLAAGRLGTRDGRPRPSPAHDGCHGRNGQTARNTRGAPQDSSPSPSGNNGRINAYDKSWEDWLKRTGELPPDFDAMPSTPFLVDPLEGVQTPEQWKQKRQQIRAQFEQWVFGKLPPQPDNLRSVITGTETDGRWPSGTCALNSVLNTAEPCGCS